jgi:fumarylacetoacetase
MTAASPAPWVDVPDGSGFGLENLPYGVFSRGRSSGRRVGVRVGDRILDLERAASAMRAPFASLAAQPSLNRLMAAGPRVWMEVRVALTGWLSDPSLQQTLAPHLVGLGEVELHLPFEVADYVDFYSSEHHATNVGRIFRPGQAPLQPNWKYLPVGYHGRTGTVAVSGTPVVRPAGQRKPPEAATPVFGPSTRLDFEVEVGFVVGMGSRLGTRVPLAAFPEHVFGVVLVNDWSARDIQPWETVPLGPFASKSFLTSVSPWVVPLAALEAARAAPPPHDPPPLPYLDDRGHPWALDLRLEVQLNRHVVSRPRFARMYWTAAQQLAHLTVNGASLRTGDLYASGTVSGPERGERGCLLELTWGGQEPLELPDASSRTFLEDGDEVTITATAPGPDGTTIGFGEVSGQVRPCPRD